MCDLRIGRTRPDRQIPQENPSLFCTVTKIALTTLAAFGLIIGGLTIGEFLSSPNRMPIEKDTCPAYTAQNCYPVCDDPADHQKVFCQQRGSEWYDQPTLVHAIQDRFPECSEPEQAFILFIIGRVASEMRASLPPVDDNQCPSLEHATFSSKCEDIHFTSGIAMEDIKELAHYSFAADPKKDQIGERPPMPQSITVYLHNLEDDMPWDSETVERHKELVSTATKELLYDVFQEDPKNIPEPQIVYVKKNDSISWDNEIMTL